MLTLHEDALAEALAGGRPLYCGAHSGSGCSCAHKALDDCSYGCIVVARGGEGSAEPVVAMVAVQSSNPKEGVYYAFPKGHADAGEGPAQAALREVLEEVGLDCRGCLLPEVFLDQGYSFTGRLHSDRWRQHPDFPDEFKRPFCVSHKLVRLYLSMVPEAAPLTPQPGEAVRAEWVPLSQAFQRLAAGRDGDGAYRDFFATERVLGALAPPPFSIRSVAGEADVAAMCAIYAPYVQHETCTWALAPEELPQVAEWVEKWRGAAARGLPWLVAVEAGSGAVVGYCSVSEFRSRGGWRNACEHGIYTAPGWQRRGLGRALLQACVQRCRGAGVAALVAVISVHPESGAGRASCALHKAMGFEEAGYLRGVGAKLGQVLDCQLMCRYIIPLSAGAGAAAAAEGGAGTGSSAAKKARAEQAS
jgi:L-amino acid N-acyltransferase YncA/8-oxo-dGTP pyrophosphatase MutT (NUDIX family)